MSGNTESTNSRKFTPMPMATLLANLQSLDGQEMTPDTSFSSGDDNDESVAEIVSKQPPKKVEPKKVFVTPIAKSKPNVCITSEKKISSMEINKENKGWLSNKTYPDKDNVVPKINKLPTNSSSDIKKRNALMPHKNNNTKNINSAHEKTPETIKPQGSTQKSKILTPVIKSGIRKFTPTSGQKNQKKTPQKLVTQSREKVKCELFTQNQQNNEHSLSVPKSADNSSVPETPLNQKQMPASYVATPSYPQGAPSNGSKIMFKTTTIKDKKYMFIKKLGLGGSSEVYKVLDIATSCEYAVKCVYLATDRELAQSYVNEVRLLKTLQNSDRVIRLFDYEYDRNSHYLRIVLEVGETDLSSVLKARGASLPPALVLHYWEEMLLAVNYIHMNGVIHADLKPANFLLVCGRLKLIDFGIASAISSDATSVVRSQATGTYSYISPEALMGGAGGYGASSADGKAPIKISKRSDVWSLGCILYCMVYGRTPFGHIPNLAKLAAILDPNHRIDYPLVERLPFSLIAAMKWCLRYNSRERPSVDNLLAVPYIQPAREPLPPPLLEKLRPLVTPQEFNLLQRATIHALAAGDTCS